MQVSPLFGRLLGLDGLLDSGGLPPAVVRPVGRVLGLLLGQRDGALHLGAPDDRPGLVTSAQENARGQTSAQHAAPHGHLSHQGQHLALLYSKMR
eukprot:365717-Chlamydomonas_euryale.AAC.3